MRCWPVHASGLALNLWLPCRGKGGPFKLFAAAAVTAAVIVVAKQVSAKRT